MLIKTNFTLGGANYEITIDERNEMDALHKAAILSNPPRYCTVCKNDQFFTLDSNKDKDGNIYVNVKCMKSGCYAKAKLGQYKSGGYFWHRFEKYVPTETQTMQKGQPQTAREAVEEEYEYPEEK